MDPEAVKSMVERSLRRLGSEVENFGGTVDKYIGDNVMALFGAPVAHEDDAERAVRAALAMQESMAEINGWLPGDTTFALRVGVNTGEVMAGAVGDRYTVTGDTVNVASRLQSAGRPGTVTVGARTVQATRHAVGYHELTPLTLKGKASPVPAWEATGLTAAHSLRRATSPASPFTGRDRELGALEEAYGRVVREGRAHMVTVIGEAGVGKSRLVRELEQRLAGMDPAVGLRGAAACPTARVACTGRSARRCAAKRASSTPTAPTRPGRSWAPTWARRSPTIPRSRSAARRRSAGHSASICPRPWSRPRAPTHSGCGRRSSPHCEP